MTFQEKFDELKNEFALKSHKFIKADTTLTETIGFGDINSIANYERVKLEWQKAANKYHNFIEFFNKSGKAPSDEFI